MEDVAGIVGVVHQISGTVNRRKLHGITVFAAYAEKELKRIV
jgi:hypothetical protein